MHIFDQLRNINMKLPCNICEKTAASNHNPICCDTWNINECIFFAIAYLGFIAGNFRKTVHLGIVRNA